MLTYAQAIILGLVQGLTELFPISSLGHSVIIPALLGWNIDQNASFFLTFLVATHLATALALLTYFWYDWVLIVKGLGRSIAERRITENDTYAKLGWLLVVGTIPAGLVGLILEKKLTELFSMPLVVAIFLFLNGLLLLGAEVLKRENVITNDKIDVNKLDEADKRVSRISWWQAAKVGLAQCLALIPGFSRTGATLAGGLGIGLDHEAAARFAFLLATPIIFAAAVLKLPELAHAPHASLLATLIGAVVAAIAAFFSITFLTKYFKTKTLTPFGIYCLLAGALSIFIFLIK